MWRVFVSTEYLYIKVYDQHHDVKQQKILFYITSWNIFILVQTYSRLWSGYSPNIVNLSNPEFLQLKGKLPPCST